MGGDTDAGWSEVNGWTGAEPDSSPEGEGTDPEWKEAVVIIEAGSDSSPEREGTDVGCSEVDGMAGAEPDSSPALLPPYHPPEHECCRGRRVNRKTVRSGRNGR